MKKHVSIYAERLYPYAISIGISVLLNRLKFNFLDNANVDNLIDGLVTMESIVIGLIGAIIPVIMSMKNDSKFVKYVFENDTRQLFRKYMTATIACGLTNVACSLAMYLRESFSQIVCKVMYNAWIFLIFLFLLLTYRSMHYMILIIFTPDKINDMSGNESELKISKDESEELREKYKRNF